MSRLLKVFNHPLTGRFLVTLLLAFGLSSICCAAFFPAAVGAGLALWCGLFSLIFTGCSALRFRFKGLFFLLLAAVLAVLGIVGKTGPVHSLLEAAKAFVLLNTGWVEILHLYAGVLTPLFCFLLTLTAWGASADESGFSSALFSLAASVILFLVSPAENMLLLALPAFAGFALQLSRQRRFTIAALPFVVLLVIAAFLLTPKAPPTSKPLQEMAESIRTAIEDRLLYTSQRTSFSLKTEGFQPLDTRLGGKPNPSDAEVMRVETKEKVLLRGKTYDFYTGVSWEDSLSSKRYLYNSIYNKDLRTDLLAMDRPLFAVPEQMERNVTIHFLKNGTTTLFAPAYTRDLRMLGQRMVLYFNTAGELFLTRDTLAGDSYSLSYLPLHAGHEQTARLVASCAGMTDPYYDIIAGQYLTLPGHIQQEVYDIAFDAVEDNATPYEKALQLQSYLQRNYAYSLDVETPPENVDFTAYFLLGEKKGYCTYFATAMTVLCRINGIPARYVTGYLADPDESGTALVQGKHAHAWTEIYLNGLGWLPIDATGSANTPEEPGNNPPPPASSPAPTPSPSPAPTPSPTPGQTPSQNEQTPTPSPSSMPTNQPTAAPPQDESHPESRRNAPPAWPWLLLLLALGAIAFRAWWTLPETRAKRKPYHQEQIFYQAMESVLALMELKRHPAQTLHGFAEQVAQKGFDDAADTIITYAGSLYGNKHGHERLLRSQYRALYHRLSLPKKLLFHLQCMLGRA